MKRKDRLLNEYSSSYHKISFVEYDVMSTSSKLKVHDDHEFLSSPTSTAIYLVQKPSSTTLTSVTPMRDDEGYSGSSNVSDNHVLYESAIISANELLEQYRMRGLHNHQSSSSLCDRPKQYPDEINPIYISSNVSLV